MRFLDLFAGIGGFREGMERAGHECVGYVEIDKFARKSYEAIYDTEGEWTAHDITTVTDDDIRSLRGQVDVVCGGFPCQAFSVAGKRGGFQDTRGTLFFDIARIAKQIKPRILLLENVKGLLSHDKGKTFGTILKSLDELGYDAEWQVLNSKDFGVPQNRERVFIVGHLRGSRGRKVFPIRRETEGAFKAIGDMHGGPWDNRTESNRRVYNPDGLSPTVTAEGGGGIEPKIVDVVGNTHPSGKGMNGQVYNTYGLSPTLTTNKGEGPKIVQTPRGNNKGGIYKLAPTVTSNSYQDNNHIISGLKVRRLTPKECWRLQGFSDEVFHKAEEVNSNSQLYKQAGNSVTVNVIEGIAKRL